MTEIPYVRQSLDFETPVHYAYGPDSSPQPDVPHGTTVEFEWNESAVFPGTTRRVWVHVPAQYTPAQPASLMVFQDGQMYLDPDGDLRCGVVFDNLIHRGEMPVTIGVFIMHGRVKAEDEKTALVGRKPGQCRATCSRGKEKRERRKVLPRKKEHRRACAVERR